RLRPLSAAPAFPAFPAETCPGTVPCAEPAQALLQTGNCSWSVFLLPQQRLRQPLVPVGHAKRQAGKMAVFRHREAARYHVLAQVERLLLRVAVDPRRLELLLEVREQNTV